MIEEDIMPDVLYACPDANWEPSEDIYASREKEFDHQVKYTRASSKDEWRDIESAPRDGMKILGTDGKGFYYVCYWQDFHPMSGAGQDHIAGKGDKGCFYYEYESVERNSAMRHDRDWET